MHKPQGHQALEGEATSEETGKIVATNTFPGYLSRAKGTIVSTPLRKGWRTDRDNGYSHRAWLRVSSQLILAFIVIYLLIHSYIYAI